MVGFLRDKGKIAFDLESEEWQRYKKASEITDEKQDKTPESEDNLSELIQNFPNLSKDRQEDAWKTIIKDDKFAENLGFSLGSNFKGLDKDLQERAWQEAKLNRSFSTGLGSSLGESYRRLEDETRERAWNMTYVSDRFSSGFGRYLAESFNLLDESSRKRFMDQLNSDEYFAAGAVSTFARLFQNLNQSLQRSVWDLASKSGKVASAFGFSIGGPNFSRMSEELKISMLRRATSEVPQFTNALAEALGKNFSFFNKETQDAIWNRIVKDDIKDEFTNFLGKYLGENYTLLDKQVQCLMPTKHVSRPLNQNSEIR